MIYTYLFYTDVQLKDANILGAAAIVTATLRETRIWSIEGQLIGQFGSGSWDVSVGTGPSIYDPVVGVCVDECV